MKKILAEFIGTCFLTFIGCASIVFMGALGAKNLDAIIPVSLTFGFAVAGIYTTISNISGGHLNPAVTVGKFLSSADDMTAGDLVIYLVAQFAGALLGAGILAFVVMQCELGGVTAAGLGAVYYGSGVGAISINIVGTAVVEAILTFIFVFVFLSVTNNEHSKSRAGAILGLTFAGLYFVSYALNGGSLNPARSLAPAVVLFGFGSTKAIEQVLVFIIAPLIAAAFSSFLYVALNGKGQKVEIVAPELPKKEEPAPKPTSVKKSATKAKPTTPSRFEKTEEKPKRRGFFSGEVKDKTESTVKKDTKKDSNSSENKGK